MMSSLRALFPGDKSSSHPKASLGGKALTRLVIMRHGHAEPMGPDGTDFSRPLSARGRSDVAAAGRWLEAQLAESHSAISQALVSSAARTQETYAALRQGCTRLPAQPSLEKALYTAGVGDLDAILARQATDCLLVVGHNPTMGCWIATHANLSQEQAVLFMDMRPGCLAILDRQQDRWCLTTSFTP